MTESGETSLEHPLSTTLAPQTEQIRISALLEWTKPGFDVQTELDKRSGPFIEVGGPTWGGYELVPTEKLKTRLYVSNIPNPSPTVKAMVLNFVKGLLKGRFSRKVHFQADGRELPLANSSVGALLGSALPTQLREKLFKEAYRVLEPGGLLVFQTGTDNDKKQIEKLGFEITQYKKYLSTTGDAIWSIIGQKQPIPQL